MLKSIAGPKEHAALVVAISLDIGFAMIMERPISSFVARVSALRSILEMSLDEAFSTKSVMENANPPGVLLVL